MNTLPTSEGEKTIPEIIDHLTYCSYRANREYGMSHERLNKLSAIFTDAMRDRYERENKPQIEPNDGGEI